MLGIFKVLTTVVPLAVNAAERLFPAKSGKQKEAAAIADILGLLASFGVKVGGSGNAELLTGIREMISGFVRVANVLGVFDHSEPAPVPAPAPAPLPAPPDEGGADDDWIPPIPIGQ